MEERPVRVQTTHGAVEGMLRVPRKVRTLDELNLPAQRFLRVRIADSTLASSCFEAGSLDIHKESILFLTDSAGPQVAGDRRVERLHFLRTAVRLKVGDFEIQGFLHVRGVRDPITWLAHARQPFLALTAASVVGPGTELALPFLAVSPRHVVVAQGVEVAEDGQAPAPDHTEAAAVPGA
jgi:hypothetical protein